MQQSVVHPLNTQRGMGAKGGNGQSEFWTRRPLAFYHANKANKKLTHRIERRVLAKKELAEWEEEMIRDFAEDYKELQGFFEDYDDTYDDVLDFELEDYIERTRTAQLSTFDIGGADDAYFNPHNEPYYSGCPICGPLGCILD